MLENSYIISYLISYFCTYYLFYYLEGLHSWVELIAKSTYFYMEPNAQPRWPVSLS